jgi:hypothetical protein
VSAHPFARSQPPPSNLPIHSDCLQLLRPGPTPCRPPPSFLRLGRGLYSPPSEPPSPQNIGLPTFCTELPPHPHQLFVFLLFFVFKGRHRGAGLPRVPLPTSFALRSCSPPSGCCCRLHQILIPQIKPLRRFNFRCCSRGSCVCVCPLCGDLVQPHQHPPMTARGSALPPFPRTTGDPLHSPLSSLRAKRIWIFPAPALPTQILRPAFSSPFPSPPR